MGGRISLQSDISRKFSKDVQSIVVGELEYDDLSRSYHIGIDMYLNLKEIIIHDCNFSICRAFLLTNLPLLQTLNVGDNSFNLYGGQRVEAPFSITNCPSLTTIAIGDSFHKYTSFYLSGEALPFSCECRL